MTGLEPQDGEKLEGISLTPVVVGSSVDQANFDEPYDTRQASNNKYKYELDPQMLCNLELPDHDNSKCNQGKIDG